MTTFHDVAGLLLADLSAAIAAGPTTLPERVGVVPGGIAWDSCGPGQCGQLVISISRFFLADSFPMEMAGRMDGCGAPYFCADYVLQLIRCTPGPDQSGNPPSTDALAASAQEIDLDGELVLPTVACSLQTLMDVDTIANYAIASAPIVGPSGGCAGVQVNFSVARVR